MRVSVVLSTYNQPRWLELVLWGYASQTHREFQVVVADDGSGEETASVVRRMAAETGLDLLHVWHEDRGFRKPEILNRAIVASSGDYLIFSDGDCVPRGDFVATHVRLAEPGHFLSGGYLKLPARVSERVTAEEVRNGRVFDVRWLRQAGWRPGRHAIRLVPQGRVARVLDAVTPTRPTWNGHNASTWREALVAVNGFESGMGYGGEDRALGDRLGNLGMRGRQVRFRAPCLHLHHDRPYIDPERVRENRSIRDRILREGLTRAQTGIAELTVAAPESRHSPSRGL